ncbi:ATP-binding cassette domain-containing protein [Streptomyces sp. NPDC002476]|uniref:ATP-binding cassette domain-containing protein n=1 Tax=Streptomyces sp. NPDC002476 TaxID=3364648 RepID=UPI0036C44F69
MNAAAAPTDARAGFAHVVATALKLAFRSARGVLVCHLAVALVTAIAPVAATWLVEDVLDVLATEPTVRAIARPACALAAISAVMAVTPQIGGYLRARLTRATGLRAQARLHASVDTFTGLRRFEDPAFLDQLRLAQQAGGLAPSQVVEGAAGIVRSIVLLVGFVGSLAVLHPLLAVVVTVSGVPVLWAARAAAQGAMTVGDVSMLLTAVPAVQSGIGGLAGEVGQTHHSLTLFRHYVTVVGLAPDLPAPGHPRPAAPSADAIEFQDVWFRYGKGLPWILRGVTLRLERGSAVALVGVNGSGKSTRVKLLCRFYDPTRGRILWDGTDLRDIPAAELRTRIAATFQDPMRYELPALENIALGEPSALRDPGRCEEAARFAGVHEDIARLPHGYRTLLSRTFRTAEEHGTNTPAGTAGAAGRTGPAAGRPFTLQSRGYVEEHPAPEAGTAVTPAATDSPATTSTAESDGAALAVPAARKYLLLPDVSGGSMRPTYQDGDRLLAIRAPSRLVRRGTVIALRLEPAPSDRTDADRSVPDRPAPTCMIKRVAALGDERPPPETAPDHPASMDVVPPRHVFVVGDNRTSNWDSRHTGPVPLARLTGIVLFRVRSAGRAGPGRR